MRPPHWRLPAALGIVFAFAGTAVAKERLSSETQQCLTCHQSMPELVKQWEGSAHWDAGVGCFECHRAVKGDKDAIDHYGFHVATIVSPRDCAQCRPAEAGEQEASHHAEAGNILASQDALLGQARCTRAS